MRLVHVFVMFLAREAGNHSLKVFQCCLTWYLPRVQNFFFFSSGAEFCPVHLNCLTKLFPTILLISCLPSWPGAIRVHRMLVFKQAGFFPHVTCARCTVLSLHTHTHALLHTLTKIRYLASLGMPDEGKTNIEKPT